ncbi:MAG: glycine cleavage system aminomethyltransferase GcvT [Propionibacteriaceae bacterium]|nr:glycine cleavage system aminomethyltransferase GcvT [Propionibacteriaceae bacterium]
MTGLLLSPLDALHRARGAHFTEFGGWELPVRFGSDLAEHHAVRTTAGLFDLSHMAQLDLPGAAAGPGLDYALLGQHSTMPVGRASYSMILTPEGTVIDDLIVYRLAADHWFIIANAANRAVVAAELAERLAGCGAAVHDVTLDRALIAVQGPNSPAILAAAGLPEAAALGYYRCAEATLDGTPLLLCRTGYTGETGFEIACPRQAAPALWERLEAAGRDQGLTLCGLACRDTLRLEAGMPLYGHELDRDTTPIEGGQGYFVRAKAADYVGKAALLSREPRKHLVGLQGEGRRAARAGYPLVRDGEPGGHVTSGALSPTLGYPIALASVTGPEPAPGDLVEVDVRGQLTPFRVTALPFLKKS